MPDVKEHVAVTSAGNRFDTDAAGPSGHSTKFLRVTYQVTFEVILGPAPWSMQYGNVVKP